MPPVLLALVIALTAFRVVALFVSPSELGFDEAQYWSWSRHFAFGYYTKPPMIGWIIGAEALVCGDGAACVRAASPVFHGATALVLFALARRLYDARTGVWSALFYLLMPGVAVSSFLVSTDAFLLLFWSLGLYALARHVERPSWRDALLFGAAVGLGLNAKYAMIYLPVLALFYALATPAARPAVFGVKFAAGLALALALIAPNLGWNALNGFATFEHTAGNVGWSWSRINPVGGFEFLAAQFGVAGPIVFGALLNAALLGARTELPASDRFLLWLSMPIVAAITLQGFLSQANANWGATAYPAAVVLASALMLRHRRRIFLRANLALGVIVAAVVIAGTALYRPLDPPRPLRQLRQLAGWSTTAANIEAVAARTGARRVVVEGRAMTAGLLYALRGDPLEVRSLLAPGEPPRDQFQADIPWRPGDGGEATLVVGIRPEVAEALGAREAAVIDAPLYSRADGRMPVYALPR